jgi:cation transport ATPase
VTTAAPTAAPEAERHVVLDIEGMTCAACVGRIEKVLRRQPSVLDARVNLATRQATVHTTWAAGAMAASSVTVVGNALRLRRFRRYPTLASGQPATAEVAVPPQGARQEN